MHPSAFTDMQHSMQEQEETPGMTDQPHGRQMSSLDEKQQAAVFTTTSPLLVLAGAGTGKTHILAHRIRQLLDHNVPSRRIVAFTYTRRASSALDMLLATTLNGQYPLPRTDSFLALALELWLIRHTRKPFLLSAQNAWRVFSALNQDTAPEVTITAWHSIQHAQQHMLPLPAEYEHMAARYTAHKEEWHLTDAHDLLLFWIKQMETSLYISPWDHVLVDEVQEMTPLQFAVVRSLLPTLGEGFFGVGDPDQAVFKHHPAPVSCDEYLKRSWPRLKVMTLSHNYRSCPSIVAVGQTLLHNHQGDFAVTAVRQDKACLQLYEALDEEGEADWVAHRIHELLKMPAQKYPSENGNTLPSLPPREIAVLVRTADLASVMRSRLQKHEIPVSEPQKDCFWRHPQVDLLLRLVGTSYGIIQLPHDTPSLSCPETILNKGPMGISAYCMDGPPFKAHFWQSAAFKALTQAFDEHGDWPALFTWIALQNDTELAKEDANKVQIIEYSAVKGMTFSAVFLPCLEEGFIPYEGSSLPATPETECQLLYSAVNRASDALFLSYATSRTVNGRAEQRKPSRFLKRFPHESLAPAIAAAYETYEPQA